MKVYQQKKADYAYNVLKTMSDSNKEWFSISLGTMMMLNGRPTENEMTLADHILTESDISDEQFKNANQKAQALFNKFNS